ncbi:MAG: hypothetical protein ACMG57_04135 [Candidatus Dojkabacteria bacterium]
METTTTTSSTEVVKPMTSPKFKKPLVVIALILALILCLCAVIAGLLIYRGSIANTDNAGSCSYNGVKYSAGSSFPSTDTCNTCTCATGGVVCTLKACDVNLGTNPTPTPTPATPPTQIEETLNGKLLVTDSDYFYGTTKYPASIMNLKAQDLVAMTCYDYYTTFAGSTFENANGDQINDSVILSLLSTVKGSRNVSAISWCKIDTAKYVVTYDSCPSQCGGGIGTIHYFATITNGDLSTETEIPNQLGAYSKCNKSLALTKNDEFYIRCSGGEVENTAAIYKVFLDQGNYTEVTKVNF